MMSTGLSSAIDLSLFFKTIVDFYYKDTITVIGLAINDKLKGKDGVADGARTHDNRNHNPGLYQLSYNHHWN